MVTPPWRRGALFPVTSRVRPYTTVVIDLVNPRIIRHQVHFLAKPFSIEEGTS